jgi:S-formylglutathione hydrolase
LRWCCLILRLVHTNEILSNLQGGAGVDGEDESWDFGTGAGFYINATQPGWKDNYKMYSYVTEELPALIFEKFPIESDKVSITGHSMGTDAN